ncbi:MAG TPA: amino acid adenylation domain-containing protein [Gemmatimonadaceae bacterium]|jgi:amino acid adenylation domain-containing protein
MEEIEPIGVLLDRLRTLDIRLTLDADRLRVSAPPGALTQEIRDELRMRRDEIRAALGTNASGAVARPLSNDGAPLSLQQERLWFFHELEPMSTTYNIAAVLTLTGPLDVAALGRALDAIVERQAMLRTTFEQHAGEPRQRVHAPSPLALAVDDLSTAPRANRQRLAEDIWRAQGERPFDLAAEFPFRVRLIRLDANEHHLLVTFHHIAADGTSLVLFVQELAELYRAFTAGEEPQLAPLPMSYTEYGAWQRRWMDSPESRRALDYWVERLGGELAVLDLPADHPRPAIQTFRGKVKQLTLSSATSAGLRALSQRSGCTLFMTMLAAFDAVLYRYAGEEDLIVGAPMATRDRIETQGLIGMFVNTLVLRSDLRGNPTFTELLSRVRRTCLDAFAHQDVPFARLLETLRPQRDLSRAPLFQVMFNMFPGDVPDVVRAGDLTIQSPPMDRLLGAYDGQSKFDVTLYALDRAAGMELMLAYNADLFEEPRMARFLADFEAFVDRVVSDPAVRIGDVRLASATVAETPRAVHPRLSGEFTELTAEFVNGSVVARFADSVARFAERAAVVTADHRWTYADLAARAKAIASNVVTSVKGQPARIALLCDHDAPMVAAILGVLTAGAAYVPLDPTFPEDRLMMLLDDADVTALLVDTRHEALAARIARGRSVVRTDAPAAPNVTLPSVDPDATAYILFTSGSTGRPKGVFQSQRNILHYVRGYTNALGLTRDERLTLVASYTFDAAVVDIFSALLNGASLYPVSLKTNGLHGIARVIEEHAVTVYHSTPTLFRALVPHLPFGGIDTVRAVVMGGETVQPHDVRLFNDAFGDGSVFVNLYGASEVTIATMAMYPRGDAGVGTSVGIGRPIEETEILLLDADGTANPVSGEITVQGPHLALGYWNAVDLTANVFRTDATGRRLYRTGDLGRRAPDGTLEFLGRKDEQIKIRGVRIEPGEIEAALRTHPTVAQCVVVADTSLGSDPVLLAFVTARESTTVVPSDLEALIASALPEYMVPSNIMVLDALPLTRTGKINRRALPTARDLGVSARREFVAPRDAIEELVAVVWSEVLGVRNVGIHDNFFALGGNSLNATQVIARLREMTHADLPLRALFSAPTVEGFAAQVRERTEAPSEPEPKLEARPHAELSPLSFSQERMWFLQELIPEGTAYNMVLAVELNGAFSRDAFVGSLGDIVARQQALRTTFDAPGGEPRQRIAADGVPTVIDADLRELPESEREAAARRLATEHATRPFDLQRGPLWWTLIMRTHDDRHILVLGFHHIIGDLWSFGVLGHELSEFYNARVRNATPAVMPIDVQYSDFALWQREWLVGRRLHDQMSYWTDRLKGIAPLDLPIDKPRPSFFTGRGDRELVDVPPGLVQRIQTMSVRENVTPFMIYFAVFNVLLHRYSGRDDIAVGVPIANRTRVGTEQLIGTFVNTLVHRNDLSESPSFVDMLRRVRGTAIDAFMHQDLPFEQLVRELAPERDPSRSPIFQVMFNMANAPVRGAELADLTGKVFIVDRNAVQFELTFSLGVGENKTVVAANYNSDLFEHATISRMLANYLTLLDAATREPMRSIDKLPIMPVAARRDLVDTRNQTAGDFPNEPVTALIAAQALRAPNAVAIESGDTKLTYAELDARANRLAHFLRRRGVQPGALVGVSLNRSADMVVSLLAVLKSGAAYVPIDPTYPPHRVQFMLTDSGATAVITESSLARKLPETSAAQIVIDRDAADIAKESSTALPEVPQPRDRAYVIYTSGSTGEPKGVQIPHEALVNFLASMAKVPGMTATDSLIAITTISFDIAGLELYLPLVTGATIVLADRQVATDGRRLRDLLVKRQPTVMQATPATWRALIDAGWTAGETPNLKILCGGEAFPRDLAEELLTRAREVWNVYGPTETTIWSTAHRVTSGIGSVPIGLPIANTRVYVLDAAGQLTPDGVPGELYIGGTGLALGYLNRPELTASRFVDDPFVGNGERMYRTGDRVRYLPDGTLEHLGRLDNQVKVRGYRIELGEIETALAASPAINRCVVDVRQDRLVAYVVFADGQELTASELRGFLRDTLPDFMVPSLVVPLAELPLTPNGKVDRRALPDPLRTAGRAANTHVPPSTPAELVIAEIWREALGVERVSSTDNFFELGGHSLLSMRVVHEIQRKTGWRPDPRLLFFETLASIAAAKPDSVPAGGVA